MRRIVVTGAAGFIGRALCRALAERGHDVLGLTRGPAPAIPGAALRPIGTIGPHSEWRPHLRGAEIVVHLATRAHRTAPLRDGPPAGQARGLKAHPRGDTPRDPRSHGDPAMAAQGPQNEATAARALACAAAASGVRRLVHMSSLRAMGEETQRGAPFRADDSLCPSDPYGHAKLAIERALAAAAAETGLELVILRPPLVYGPAVKGNLRALLRLVAAGLPLPFAAVDNRRSLVFLDNLVDLTIRLCLDPGAAGRVWLVRDVDLSTPDLVRALAAGLGRRPRLFALPEAVFAAARRLPCVGPLAVRLTASLAADDRATRAALGWTPPFPPAAGLAATARAFRARP